MNCCPSCSWARTAVVLGAFLGITILAFAAILALGARLPVPLAAPPARHFGTASLSEVLPLLLATLAGLLLVTRVFAAAARRIGQPPVVGEVLAGIALGPSLLGRFWPELARDILPPVLPVMSVLANLGVILFLFLVGLEFNSSLLVGRRRTAAAITVGGVALPFVLGGVFALALFPSHAMAGASFPVFALFLGTALSVTGLPLLARMLGDLGLTNGPLGVLTLASAAVTDVLAWCLLALVVGVSEGEFGTVILTVGLTLAYGVVMLVVVRPLVRRLAAHLGPATQTGDFGLLLALALLSALATEAIGIHPLFGAFLLGAVIPHDSPVARESRFRMETLVTGFFLPIFFAWSGLRTQMGLLDSLDAWSTCAAILGCAFVSKMGGIYLAGIASGLPGRDAASLGVLLNTRGLVSLVVLNVGLDLGILSPSLFTMLVLMAVTTTLATMPMLALLTGARLRPPVPLTPGS